MLEPQRSDAESGHRRAINLHALFTELGSDYTERFVNRLVRLRRLRLIQFGT